MDLKSFHTPLTRKAFLKSVGLTAATAALGPFAGSLMAAEKETSRDPAQPPSIKLTVNGEARTVEGPPQMTLLAALRDRLDLTGAKPACEQGTCGACTVLMDGLPVNACMMLAIDAAGKSITTVEGLAKKGLTPIQEALIYHDGMQCGFCTPGVTVSLHALLERQSRPSSHEIKTALSGHLCRCGAYSGMMAAALSLAKGERLPRVMPSAKEQRTGRGVPRLEGRAKVTGEALYAVDARPKGWMVARALDCPFARGKIVNRPNETAARMVAGVQKVEIFERTSIGQPFAVVVAETMEAAEEGLTRLAIQAEPF